jgi:hypothetical protein
MAKKRSKRPGRSKGRRGVNKSQAIRDYLAENPKTPPRQIAAELTERGIKVTPMFVSAIKSKSRGRRRKTRDDRPHVARNSSVTIDRVILAKRFADSVGGVATARRALEALQQVLR